MIGGDIHILYVITDLELGGVPLHLYRLVMEVRKHGYRPTVVSLAPPGPVGKKLRDDGVPVLNCEGCCGWDLRVIPRLGRIIRDTPSDLIHSLLFHANVAVRLAGKWVGYPAKRMLCEIQTVEVERRWHLTVDRWTHRWCGAILGNSPSVIEHLATAAGIPRDRLYLVRGGIDPEPIRTAPPADRAALGVPAAAKIVFWAGRLDPIKGLDVLIRAFAMLDRGLNAHLLLAGEGPRRARLLEQARQAGLSDRVHLLGARRDVPSLLRLADVFAFPSRTEGLPNALLEAMAAGCAIVTTDVPGCRDLITHERDGLLVPWGDAAALADGLRRLLSDRVLAARLGESAGASVTTNWHARSTWADYLQLYENHGRPNSSTARP